MSDYDEIIAINWSLKCALFVEYTKWANIIQPEIGYNM